MISGAHVQRHDEISGHQTESMQRRYSTVAPDEMRGALAAVIDFASGRRVG